MEYSILVLLHVLLAIILIGAAWMGSFIIVPWAAKSGNAGVIADYFRPFYKMSHALLAVQFLIGFRLAMIYLPMSEWFSFSTSISLTVVLKIALWVVFFTWMIIGKRKGLTDSENVNLPYAKQFFLILSILGLAMVVTGLNFRLGLF